MNMEQMEALVEDDVEVVIPGSSLLKQLRKKGMMRQQKKKTSGLFGGLLNKSKVAPIHHKNSKNSKNTTRLVHFNFLFMYYYI